jgi:ribonuclease Z
MNRSVVLGFIVGVFASAALLLSLSADRNLNVNSAVAAEVEANTLAWSPTKPYPTRDVYFPGMEELGPDEMRVIACGTGMPIPRLKQAAACFLVELGNGDKFIFDMGEGSYERLSALEMPLDQLDKVFLGHLHLDHAGDFPAFYATGPVNNRLRPVRLFGPSGVREDWGTKAWANNMLEMWQWELASRGGVVDSRGLELEVNEFDWRAVNNVIYDENGVQVRTIPAIHADQSVSFILEWNGLSFAYSSDTVPNIWWAEHTKGVDLSVHECFPPPALFASKLGFTPDEAVLVGTQGHTTAAAFGKIMAMTKPRRAVCYHFQNDFDIQPAILEAVRQTYDGPLDLATDFMVWNVTRNDIRTRMAVVNEESFAAPAQRTKIPPKDPYQWTGFSLSGMEPESSRVANEIIAAFNKANGSDAKPSLTGFPFLSADEQKQRIKQADDAHEAFMKRQE